MENKHEYYMPLGTHEFLGWAKNFVAVAQANKALFGFTDAELTPLGTGVDTLDAAEPPPTRVPGGVRLMLFTKKRAEPCISDRKSSTFGLRA
jgi:hypothetical protein